MALYFSDIKEAQSMRYGQMVHIVTHTHTHTHTQLILSACCGLPKGGACNG